MYQSYWDFIRYQTERWIVIIFWGETSWTLLKPKMSKDRFSWKCFQLCQLISHICRSRICPNDIEAMYLFQCSFWRRKHKVSFKFWWLSEISDGKGKMLTESKFDTIFWNCWGDLLIKINKLGLSCAKLSSSWG